MVADKMAYIDGKWYQPGEGIWDLGSFEAVRAKGCQRHYEGLSADVGKLPHYVGPGSSALCLDTGDYYKYHEKTDTWYKL